MLPNYLISKLFSNNSIDNKWLLKLYNYYKMYFINFFEICSLLYILYKNRQNCINSDFLLIL